MVPYETPIIFKQDVIVMVKLPWQWKSPAKAPYILDLVAHISKTNSVTPLFFIAEKCLEGPSDCFSEIKMRVTKFVFEI